MKVSKTSLILTAVGLLSGVSAGGWFYHTQRPSTTAPPQTRAKAVIMAAPQPTATPAAASSEAALPSPLPARPRFRVPGDPMNQVRADITRAVVDELSPSFPDLKTVLGFATSRNAEPRHQRLLFELLDSADKAREDQKPAILLAANLVAQEIGCDTEYKEQCEKLRAEFARYKLRLNYSELDGGYFYQGDLLNRIWQDYPETQWGERTFVLLLDRGWDPSTTCEKGTDQFREVIRQGEWFLQQRPASSYGGAVTFLVAQAYITWWTLSNETETSDMADYINAEEYRKGAEEARLAAIRYFEELERIAPETQFGHYARRVLPSLKEQQVPNHYRFFCIYD